jgi:sensor histidine kinase regulating citrate/malate metabolism
MKWFHRLSLKRKLTLITLAATLVPVVVAGTLFVVYDMADLRRGMKEDLRMVADGVAINSTPALVFESLDSARDILGALRANPHIEMAVIYDVKGNSVDYRRSDLEPAAVPSLARKEGAYFESGKLRIYRDVVREGKILGTIFIESDTAERRERLAHYARVAVIVALSSVLTTMVLASQLQKLISPPAGGLAAVETSTADDERRGLDH